MNYKIICSNGMVIFDGELNGAQLAAISDIVDS